VTPGIVVLIVAVVGALAFGGYRATTDGRFRGKSVQPSPGIQAGTPWADELGEQATLLQFSSAFCAPCRATRRVLEDVARNTDGVAHIEVDAEGHLDLVRRLDVLRTPTTLVLDRDGREVARAAGAPTKQQVLAALAQLA
jgi:thiol-disulfide isomerase/thioredoxin